MVQEVDAAKSSTEICRSSLASTERSSAAKLVNFVFVLLSKAAAHSASCFSGADTQDTSSREAAALEVIVAAEVGASYVL